MVRTGKLEIPRFSRVHTCMAVEYFGAEGSRGEFAVADLILLSLQLCLGSDSRHVPGGNVIRAGAFGAVLERGEQAPKSEKRFCEEEKT